MTNDCPQHSSTLLNNRFHHRLDEYPVCLDSDTNRLALVINNNFPNTDYKRDGSLVDLESIVELLEHTLHYNVTVHTDKTSQEMKEVLEDFAKNEKHSECDSVIVVIMSHGCQKGLYGNDGSLITVAEITHFFKKCPNLQTKPKIFMINACRGGKSDFKIRREHCCDENEHSVDTFSLNETEMNRGDFETANSTGIVSYEADVLILYSTPEGYRSLRSISRGSRFVQGICEVFKNHAKRFEIAHLFYRVNNWMRNQLQPDHKQFHNPFTFDILKSTDLFIGRRKQLTNLHKLMNPSLNSGFEIVICGLGGVGKSHLVKKYMKEYFLDYDSFIWINSESLQSTSDSFINLSKNLNVAHNVNDMKILVAAVYKKISDMGLKNLVVFDNADDFIPADFMPNILENFFVIITSRNQQWPHMKQFKLEVFEDIEAKDFIKKSLSNKNYNSNKDVEMLANVLQNFPLALQQAVAYIRQCHDEQQLLSNRFTINDYLKEYGICKVKLLNYKHSLKYNNINTVTTLNTWTVTVKKLGKMKYCNENSLLDSSTENVTNTSYTENLPVKILELIAYMASDKIDPNLFLEVANCDKRYLGWAIYQLVKFSMVNAETLNPKMERVLLSVHKLVQEVTRLRLKSENTEEENFKVVFHCLQQHFPIKSEALKDILIKRELLPHLLVLKLEVESFGKINQQLEQRIRLDYLEPLLRNLCMGYGNIGLFLQEKDCLLQLFIMQRTLSFPKLMIAKTLAKFGYTICKLRHYKTANVLLQRAYYLTERLIGPDNIELVHCLISLSIVNSHLGNLNVEKKLLERALNIQETDSSPDQVDIATTLQNLANVYGRNGDSKTQKYMLERALKITKNHVGPNHARIATILANLGALCDPETHKHFLERALFIEETRVGNDHFELIPILVNLSNAYTRFGDVETQIKLLERALAIEEKYFGYNRVELIPILENLASAYGEMEFHEPKMRLLSMALKIREDKFGYDHFDTLETLARIAMTYGDMGDKETQRNMLEKGLNILTGKFGDDHIEVGKMLRLLAHAQDNPETKIELFKKALKIIENHYGSVNLEIANTLQLLAYAYMDIEKTDIAKDMLMQALKIFESFHIDDYISVEIRMHIAVIEGDFSKSKPAIEKYLLMAKERLRPNDDCILCALKELAKGYVSVGDEIQEATVLFEYYLLQYPNDDARKTVKKKLGENSFKNF